MTISCQILHCFSLSADLNLHVNKFSIAIWRTTRRKDPVIKCSAVRVVPKQETICWRHSTHLSFIAERHRQPQGERRHRHRGWSSNSSWPLHVRPPGHGHPDWRKGEELRCNYFPHMYSCPDLWPALPPSGGHLPNDTASVWPLGALWHRDDQQQRQSRLHHTQGQKAGPGGLSNQNGGQVSSSLLYSAHYNFKLDKIWVLPKRPFLLDR